ncbi:hypothetical protein KIL84_019630 [Mauremys mutica]|uniref:Uncharacterized protein n=1 Tax=Mauremys mutica TaxID=74926 RepID=A0A9D3XV98_9SAUR|nr:hypothetical protein KIL84_019630 [Mauremys mutica]
MIGIPMLAFLASAGNNRLVKMLWHKLVLGLSDRVSPIIVTGENSHSQQGLNLVGPVEQGMWDGNPLHLIPSETPSRASSSQRGMLISLVPLYWQFKEGTDCSCLDCRCYESWLS